MAFDDRKSLNFLKSKLEPIISLTTGEESKLFEDNSKLSYQVKGYTLAWNKVKGQDVVQIKVKS